MLAVYLLGSRADDGLRRLQNECVEALGSDLDVGILFADRRGDPERLARLQVALEDLFEPLRVDLVPLDRLDPIFQARAISGHRIASSDPAATDRRELEILGRAGDLIPIQRQIERDLFGASTT